METVLRSIEISVKRNRTTVASEMTVRILTLRPGVLGLTMNIVIAFGRSQTICTNGPRMKNRNGRGWSFWHNGHQRSGSPDNQRFANTDHWRNRQGLPTTVWDAD
jgi:hypothetical protein